MTDNDKAFVERVEAAHFRTNEDTGANSCAMLIWNEVRKHMGLPPLRVADLPAFCDTHGKYHVIQEDYGCVRKPSKES